MSGPLVYTDTATLPFEILGHIFSHVVGGYPIYLRALFFVCRSWYNAVRYHSVLWTDIRFDGVVANHFDFSTRFSGSLAENYYRCCLAYSGTAPLDVAVESKFLILFRRKESVLHIRNNITLIIKTFLGESGEHALRWRSFNWMIGHAHKDGVNGCLSIFPQMLPRLQTLRMHSLWGAPSRPRFPHCSQLTTVEFYQTHGDPLQDDDFLRVQKLSLGKNTIWFPKDVVLLSRFRNILHLTLYSLSKNVLFHSNSHPIHSQSVSLVHLRTLVLQGIVPKEPVTALRTPSLQEVCFNHPHSFQHLRCPPFTGTVHSIHVTVPEVDGSTQFSVEMESLLSALPALTSVFIPRWLFLQLETTRFELDARTKGLMVIVEDEINHFCLVHRAQYTAYDQCTPT